MRKYKFAVLLLQYLFFPSQIYADTVIGSWNLLHLGWNNNKDFEKVQIVQYNFDILQIQELMNEEGIIQLKNALETHTGDEYQYLISDVFGSSTYKEQYGFIWKTKSIEYIQQASSYIKGEETFERPPFQALFQRKDNSDRFVMGTIHIKFGRNYSSRKHEIQQLRQYFDFLKDEYSSDYVIIQGDMNSDSNKNEFLQLRNVQEPLISDKTSLSTKANKYANQYDQIFLDKQYNGSLEQGIIKFPEIFNDTGWKYLRQRVSDHLPVFVILQD